MWPDSEIWLTLAALGNTAFQVLDLCALMAQPSDHTVPPSNQGTLAENVPVAQAAATHLVDPTLASAGRVADAVSDAACACREEHVQRREASFNLRCSASTCGPVLPSIRCLH